MPHYAGAGVRGDLAAGAGLETEEGDWRVRGGRGTLAACSHGNGGWRESPAGWRSGSFQGPHAAPLEAWKIKLCFKWSIEKIFQAKKIYTFVYI